MVDRKGTGYALESIVAVATVFIFIFGGLQVPENQNWDSFRRQVSADDLTYALQDSGYMNHALSEGEVGSIQTAFSTISERRVEVSGLVSNLPINENKVAFYTKPSRRYTQGLMDASSGSCAGDLDEIASRSEEPVLQTDGTGVDANYPDERVYVADLDPNQVGGNNVQDYDSVWVDNGTDCQFSNAEGPFYRDEFIKWGPHHYDVEWINGDTNELRLFNATQAVRFRNMLNRPVNSVDTFVTVDSVNFTEVDTNTYNVLVVRTSEGVRDISANQGIMEDHLNEGSLMVLASLDSSNFDNGDFLERAGFQYISVPYEGSYSGGEVPGRFSSESRSQEVETYFKGLGGESTSLSIAPPNIISNTTRTLESAPAILYSATQSYNFSDWNREEDDMENITGPELSNYPGRPESACYGTTDSALTATTITFPDGKQYEVINAELGTTETYCNNNNDRAVKVDLNRDGDFMDEPEGPFLNNERVVVAGREYAARSILTGSDCEWDGNCVKFVYIGSRDVELIARRTTFPEFNGGRIAVSGYEAQYSTEDRKVLASTIHWLRGDQLAFTGRTEPEGISTSTYSGIQNRTYMPYEVNLRWSR
ncbi:MAG: hypothetical protein ABEK16_00710 [Candidatus Nanohalobium sp.]